MKNYTVVMIKGNDTYPDDDTWFPWMEILSDWKEPEIEVGQSVTLVITRVE